VFETPDLDEDFLDIADHVANHSHTKQTQTHTHTHSNTQTHTHTLYLSLHFRRPSVALPSTSSNSWIVPGVYNPSTLLFAWGI